MISVQLLGGASLRSGDTPLSGPPAQRHRIALLTLIVAAWPQPLSRDRAMALLWPERDEANARRLLNLAVHVLRAALSEDAIVSTGDGLLLNPSQLSCDLQELRAALAANESERVARLYTGPLLDGFHLDDSVEFGHWLDDARRDLVHGYIGALLEVARRQEQSGDVHGRVRTCLRLVAADPHSSVYAQTLMRALDAAGDRAGAIQHANDHARRVRVDLDLAPDSAVEALATELRSPAASTVAVLPFVHLNPNPENEYFADGITEDVIAHLSKIHALKVISRTSVMPFKQRQRSLKEIGAALGARTILDGSVRQAGDRVRIVAKLIDVETDKHLWVETYDRQLTDIFAIQTDVALRIAAALKAELSRDEESRLRRKPTNDLDAYQLFFQGRAWFIRYRSDAYLRAIEYFDRAIVRDPTFALAYANLAMVYTELAEAGAMAPEVAYARAGEAAGHALRLDPELGAAHCTMAHVKMVRDLDWSGAEQSFKRALELSPSSDDTYDLYGRLCAGLGRYDDAIALQRRARELDPLAHRMDAVTTLLRAGRYDQAVREAEAAVELEPGYDRARATLGWGYFLSGRQADGVAELERAVSQSPGNTMWRGQLGQAYAMAGNATKAREILRQLEERTRTGLGYVSPYHFAYVYTGLGEFDRAMDFLERAVAERTGPAYGIKGSFLLTPLQAHPRFQTLLQRMKLAD